MTSSLRVVVGVGLSNHKTKSDGGGGGGGGGEWVVDAGISHSFCIFLIVGMCRIVVFSRKTHLYLTSFLLYFCKIYHIHPRLDYSVENSRVMETEQEIGRPRCVWSNALFNTRSCINKVVGSCVVNLRTQHCDVRNIP